MPNLNGWHLVIILLIILLLFGAPKLPGLAKSLGQSMRIFKGEMKEMRKDGDETVAPSPSVADVPPAAPQQPAQPMQQSQPTQVSSTNTAPGTDRLS